MLYVIGGPSRTGKSLVARRLISAKPMLLTSTDLIRSVLQRAAPQLGIRHNVDTKKRDAAFYPFLEAFCISQTAYEEDSVIEGDTIHPQLISELIRRDISCRPCFLGWSSIDKKDFLANQGRNAWLLERSTTEQDAIIEGILSASTRLEQECEDRDIPFVDMSGGPFDIQLNLAVRLLLDSDQMELPST